MRDAGTFNKNSHSSWQKENAFSGQQMWLKYQKVQSKMASFDPRELGKHKDDDVVKLPFKRFEPTLRKSLNVVIPMNLDRLSKHKTNVQKFLREEKWKELNIEQINASRTVQQLKATIRELDNIRHQIQEQDVELFDKQIAGMKVQAQNAIEEFVAVVATKKEDKKEEDHQDSGSGPSSASNNFSSDSSVRRRKASNTSENTVDEGAQLLAQSSSGNEEEMAALQSWDTLKNGLLDLDGLVKDFAACVHHQQEMVDNIEDNIETAHNNVNTAANMLGQASKYKAAMIPVAGAVVGAVVGGPIGLLAGFKLAGCVAAVGGGLAGYQGGKYWKKKHDKNVDMELAHLSRPEKNS